MAKTNLTKNANISTTARVEVFLSSFADSFKALSTILGEIRKIEKVPGQVLKYKKGTITLQSGTVGEGDEVPYSIAGVEEYTIGEPTLEKYKKGVSAEAIIAHGYDDAVALTDEATINKLQKNVCDKFYTFAKTGTATATYTTFQMALAMAKAHAEEAFDALDLSQTGAVAFVNKLDFYAYIGGAAITVQTAFGMDYVENFMGYRTVFLLDSTRIPRNTILATPANNIVAYYINPANADLEKAGLVYEVKGETPFIGVHAGGDYDHVVTDLDILMGLYIYAEYLDGIAVVKVEASGSLATVTGTSEAGTEVGDTKLTVTSEATVGGASYYYAYGTSAPAAPAYGTAIDTSTWTKLVSGNDYTIASGKKLTILEVNGTGQVVGASAAITVVAKAS